MDLVTQASEDSRSDSNSHLTRILEELREEVRYNRGRINILESRLVGTELRRTYSAPDGPAHTEVTDDTEIVQDYMFLTAKSTIPTYRLCNFAQFKNRFDPKGKDGRYAFDVLVSGPLLHQEIEEEHRVRVKLFGQRGPATMPKIMKDKSVTTAVKMANTANDLISEAQSGVKWPRRIRIQSPALLKILARVNEESWTTRPRTYYRPFNSLIYQHARMKEVLQELEDRWGSSLSNSTIDVRSDTSEDTNGAEYHDEDALIEDSPEALACLRAYVDYVDKNVMPDYHSFENKDVSSNAKVRFSDLWYLFRTGEFVYRQVDSELPDRYNFRTGKRIWKTYFVDPVPERMAATTADAKEIRDAAVDNDESAFTLGCYYVDYTGDEYCIVKTKVRIERFQGEMPVTALPIFPIRFCQDWEARLDHAKQTGESLVEFLKTKHCSYSGWTLIRDPTGEPTTDAKGVVLQQPEHINSEVMVDFGEAFQACPSWRPKRANMRQKIFQGMTVPEDFRIRWWSDADRTNLLGETTELIPVKSGVCPKQRNKHVSEDPFLVAVNENTKRVQMTTGKDLTDDAKILLTGRVFAYVFQERKFAQLAVGKLRPATQGAIALESLRIPQSIKHAIQGSVQGHFWQKNAERNISQDWANLDLIQGKGTGLFILLHGVPGVGKTATAEAVAQANRKPLFKITVGDLGLTPEKLETSLREIFRLASNWDCILLLDEVDTFFSERTQTEGTEKNALVSSESITASI